MIEGFHLLFHESGLAPLFHPLSASFGQKKTLFRGVLGVSRLFEIASFTLCQGLIYPTPRIVYKL